MDKKKILKEMKNAVKKVREKNAVDDVLDADTTEEMSSDSVPSSKQGVMSKKTTIVIVRAKKAASVTMHQWTKLKLLLNQL